MSCTQIIKANLNGIQERIQAACDRADRHVNDVRLIAVTKYAQDAWIHSLLELGIANLGESRPQNLVARAEKFDQHKINWHLIGHLQRNKARRVLPIVSCIHSVDSLRLLQSLDRLAEDRLAEDRTLNPEVLLPEVLLPVVLLEVNVSHDASKDGFAVDPLLKDWEAIVQCKHVQLAGLMTMAPLTENVSETRPVFAKLRALRDQLRQQSPPSVQLSELSMGMSRDFEVAVEEGATMIRIGRSLYQGLDTDGPA